MNDKAQLSLDYLLTYGWAMILIATAIGIIFFVTIIPAQNASVTINQSDKIILVSSSVDNSLQSVLQNVSSGQIKIMGIHTTDALGGCELKVGGKEANLVNAGQIMLLECSYSGKEPGSVSILYKDFTGSDQTATIDIIWQAV